jgi:hypothetical protein
MKKLKLLYAVLFAVAIIACSKDDESPTFKKEDFVGIWKEDGTEDNGCVDVVKFDATKFSPMAKNVALRMLSSFLTALSLHSMVNHLK